MPYQNQNYYNPYQYPQFYPMYQPGAQNPAPYMDRLAQLQAQQNLQPTQIPISNQFSALGKIVESVDIVKSTDIPMDGNMYYFPKADGSEIYGKQWLPNGTTRILAFKPTSSPEAGEVSADERKTKIGLSSEATEAFMGRLDDIMERLGRMEQAMANSMTKNGLSKAKKEADAE